MDSMKIMGEITCRLDAEAVKLTILYCSEPKAYRYEEWSSTAAWVTALATIALVVVAVITANVAIGTLRQTKKDSVAQTRPYVHAQVVPSIAGIGTYDLIVKNTGLSTARDLQITCPEFPKSPDDIADRLKSFFSMNHSLPPNTQLRTFWRFTVPKGLKWTDGTNEPAGMPEVATLILHYSDANGSYSEVFPVDLAVYRMAPAPDEGPDAGSKLSPDQKDNHKMLAAIARNIRELGR